MYMYMNMYCIRVSPLHSMILKECIPCWMIKHNAIVRLRWDSNGCGDTFSVTL